MVSCLAQSRCGILSSQCGVCAMVLQYSSREKYESPKKRLVPTSEQRLGTYISRGFLEHIYLE